MADYLIDGAVLTDIADSIRAKTGKTDLIVPENMSAEIEEIEGSAVPAPTIKALTITENGTYTAPDGVDGYSPVTVDVSGGGEYVNTEATAVGDYAFYQCPIIKSISYKKAKTIGEGAFAECPNLYDVDFPQAESLGFAAFYDTPIKLARFLKAKTVMSGCFNACPNLKVLDFYVLETFYNSAVYNCSNLVALILRGENVVPTPGGLTNTPIANGTGYIYVPSALIEDYKAATHWSTYADQFRALEDYTVDGTTTGELDLVKMGVEA